MLYKLTLVKDKVCHLDAFAFGELDKFADCWRIESLPRKFYRYIHAVSLQVLSVGTTNIATVLKKM